MKCAASVTEEGPVMKWDLVRLGPWRQFETQTRLEDL